MEYNVKILDKELVADGTIAFSLSKPENFSFQPGQYVNLEIKDSVGKSLSHCLSIASAPHEQGIWLATRLSDSDYKKRLSELAVGDDVKIVGPFGFFTLPTDESQKIVILTGGIGITPFLSMIRDAERNNSSREIILFYANANRARAAFLEELQNIKLENYKLVAVMSDDESWDGEKGRINAELIKKYLEDLNAATYYIAGPPAMTTAMHDILESECVIDAKIKIEEFPGY
jgi:ferredoxin-NADP reductase